MLRPSLSRAASSVCGALSIRHYGCIVSNHREYNAAWPDAITGTARDSTESRCNLVHDALTRVAGPARFGYTVEISGGIAHQAIDSVGTVGAHRLEVEQVGVRPTTVRRRQPKDGAEVVHAFIKGCAVEVACGIHHKAAV